MSTTAYDAWAHARAAATAPALEGETTRVQRRLWWRRLAGVLLGTAVAAALALLLLRAVDSSEELWDVSPGLAHLGLGLGVVGLLVMVAGAVRPAGRRADGPFVRPEHFLPRSERGWLRRQIADGSQVVDSRRTIAVAVARQLAAGTGSVPRLVGLVLFYVGMGLAESTPALAIAFGGLTVWMLVQIARTVLWAVRGRRWLARHA